MSIDLLQRQISELTQQVKQLQSQSDANLTPRKISRSYCPYCFSYGSENWKNSHICDAIKQGHLDAEKQFADEYYGPEQNTKVTRMHNVTTKGGAVYQAGELEIKRAEADRIQRRAAITANGGIKKK